MQVGQGSGLQVVLFGSSVCSQATCSANIAEYFDWHPAYSVMYVGAYVLLAGLGLEGTRKIKMMEKLWKNIFCTSP